MEKCKIKVIVWARELLEILRRNYRITTKKMEWQKVPSTKQDTINGYSQSSNHTGSVVSAPGFPDPL